MILQDQLGTVIYLLELITYDGRTTVKVLSEPDFDIFLDSFALKEKFKVVRVKSITLGP